MIKIENTEVLGWEHAIRGMRNPMNSWARSDSHECDCSEYAAVRVLGDTAYKVFCQMYKADHKPAKLCGGEAKRDFCIGKNDHALMMRLAKAGAEHAKYRRMIVVYADVTAPLYWWKEYDTYKVGTVANSCSTMHKIAAKEFTLEDFSHEHLISDESIPTRVYSAKQMMEATIENLNIFRNLYLQTKDKKYWWQIIQMLPSSYNQRRTVMLNYEVLANIYRQRLNHKLDEWRDFCTWAEQLPYSELITGKEAETDE
uniref:Uncharacterized protein n=1 Tax=Siphoviridae sp. ctkfT29 TaxID=2827278 RepID=A0A8S5RAA9_9CAUD|nr:MAG TPA: hypothetical protein [Siphoviridae sp. ctkfT29]